MKENLNLGSEKIIAVTCETSDTSALRKLAEKCKKGQLILTKATLTDESSVRAWAKDVREKHGVKHFDLVWNNAGIIGDRKTAMKMSKTSMYVDATIMFCLWLRSRCERQR